MSPRNRIRAADTVRGDSSRTGNSRHMTCRLKASPVPANHRTNPTMTLRSPKPTPFHAAVPPIIFRSADAELELKRSSMHFTTRPKADNLFASPTEAFSIGDRVYHLPRFIFFGRNQNSGPIRLALYAGWNGDDVRAASRSSA